MTTSHTAESLAGMTGVELSRLRSRWRRWLGQKDGIELLDSVLSGWMNNVFKARDLEVLGVFKGSKTEFLRAINMADFDELRKLDMIVLQEKLERGGK